MLNEAFKAYSAFLQISRPLSCIDTFKKHEKGIKALKDGLAGDAAWVTPPQVEANAKPEEVSAEHLTIPLFNRDEYQNVFGILFTQATQLNTDLNNLKAGKFEDFVGGLALGSCKGEDGYVTIWPDAAVTVNLSMDDMCQYLTEPDLDEKNKKLDKLAAIKVSSTSEHAAFSFAAYDAEFMRVDGLDVMLSTAKAQHLTAELAQEVLVMMKDPDQPLPTQIFLNRLGICRKHVSTLRNIHLDHIEQIKEKNLNVPSRGPTDAHVRDIIMPIMNSSPSFIRFLQTIVDALTEVSTRRIVMTLREACNALDGLCPDDCGMYCWFSGPTCDKDAMANLVTRYASQVSAINQAKEVLSEKILMCLRLSSCEIPISGPLDAARKMYASANLFIATLGIINLIFVKDSFTGRSLQRAVDSVKQLHVWPGEDRQLEAERIQALQGVSASLPEQFVKEVAEILDNKLTAEAAQLA